MKQHIGYRKKYTSSNVDIFCKASQSMLLCVKRTIILNEVLFFTTYIKVYQHCSDLLDSQVKYKIGYPFNLVENS